MKKLSPNQQRTLRLLARGEVRLAKVAKELVETRA